MVKVYLKPGKDEPVRRRHPWVFSGAIARVDGAPADGDIAEVYARNGDRLGVGHYHHGSIAVRLLGDGEHDVQTQAFWEERLANALRVRQVAGIDRPEQTNCFRWVHGEGDGLSGLIVDLYGDTAVVQCHSIGMHRQRELIARALRAVRGVELHAVYDKSAEALPANYAKTVENGYLLPIDGPADPAGAAAQVCIENGVRFRVDWETGQKTGFFLDQRDNRQLLRQYAAGKTVLNAFCYTGGFSCYALAAGARSVDSVDISGKAMEMTAENVEFNRPFTGEHMGYTEDVLRFLRDETRQYEVAVIDPPAFAKSLDKRHNAVQGYKRLNDLALRRVAPGGIMFTFSCSQVVDRELFYHTVVAAALESRRSVRVLHHLTQGADHPVSLFHPEGAYLKGLVLYVD
jgi:23S rRNA (cytosine1962-C5)-methyltransferase